MDDAAAWLFLAGICVVTVGGMAGGIYLFRRWRRGRRPAPPADLAILRGEELGDEFALDELPFRCFHLRASFGQSQDVDRLHRGASRVGGRRWTFVQTIVVSSQERTKRTDYAHALFDVPKVWPALGMELRSNINPIVGITGAPEVPFPNRHDFNKNWVVRSEDASFGETFVGEEMRAWLQERANVRCCEIRAGLLLVTTKGTGADAMASWGEELLQHTSEAIWPGGARRLDHPAT